MGTLNDAAAQAKNLARQFKAALAVGEALEHINSLEQAVAQAEDRARKADAELQTKLVGLADASNRLLDADAAVALAVKQAEKVSRDAELAVAKLVASARREADDLLKTAAQISTEAKAKREREVADHAEKMDDLAEQERVAQARVDALKSELAALKQRLNLE